MKERMVYRGLHQTPGANNCEVRERCTFLKKQSTEELGLR